jgi:hypothetical protein
LSGREGFGVLSPSHRALRARDSGVFGKMKCLFSIAPDARTGGKVTEVVVAVLQATDAGPASVALPQARSAEEEATDARTLTRQTLASASVAQCSAAWRSARASDAEPRLLIDRQTRLSRLSGARERSGPRLSRDRCWSGLASDAYDAGSRPLDFERAVDTWRHLRATDARDASVAPEISLVIC